MSALTFRNSLGDLVDIPAIPATRMKNEFGAILERTLRNGAVAITRHDTTKAVLLSYEEFLALVKPRAPALDDLTAEFDAMFARMQTPAVRKATAAAFNATPEQMGVAAVKAARRAQSRHAR